MLKLAIQKKGRLSDKSIDLLQKCGINFSNGSGRLITKASNFDMEILFLRDDDIPGYVEDGIVDLGIVGQNEVDEQNKKVDVIKALGFSKCRISLAVQNRVDYKGIQDFEGKSIATSYPNILGSFLKERGVNAKIKVITGSVEVAPSMGLSDAVCDIVSTGSTLLSNGLKEVEQIYYSQALLLSNANLSEEKKQLLSSLMLRIESVLKAKENKYILMNAPTEAIDGILELLPGMRAPTVLPLSTEGWSSIHSVVPEDEFWSVIEELKRRGAEGILVCPIEKMIL